MRIFFALDVPDEAKASLMATQERLQVLLPHSDVAWAKSGNLHLTLYFAGNTQEQALAEMTDALERVCAGRSPLQLELTGAGAFPSERNPRVLWVGVQDRSGQLLSLQADLAATLAPLVASPPKEKFVPHLTLGRIKRLDRLDRSILRGELPHLRSCAGISWEVNEVTIYSSVLATGGSVYKRLAHAELRAK